MNPHEIIKEYVIWTEMTPPHFFGGCFQLMDYIGPGPDQEPAMRHSNDSRLLNKLPFWYYKPLIFLSILSLKQ